MMRPTALTLILLPLLMLGGCEDDGSRPGQVAVTVVNAAPGFETLSLRRGSTGAAAIGSFEFGGRTTVQYDAGTYTYTVETPDSPSQTVIVQTTFTDEVEEGQKHLHVLAEVNEAVQPLTFSRPPFSSSSSEWELNVVNAAQSAASLDFYVQPTGTDITTVAPTGSVDFREIASPVTLQPGSYEFTLTAPGDPSMVLFASSEIEFTAGLSIEATIMADTRGVADRMTIVGTVAGNSFSLTDITAPIAARFLNGAADELARDIYLDGDFTTPFADGIGFVVVGDFLELPEGTSQIAITPDANASVVEAELVDALVSGSLHNILIGGAAGDITALPVLENLPRNYANGRLRFMNTDTTYESLSVYVVAPGTDITGTLPNVVVESPGVSPRSLISPGAREITVTDTATENVVLGPLSVTFEGGGIYTVLLHHSGDGTTVSATFLDDLR